MHDEFIFCCTDIFVFSERPAAFLGIVESGEMRANDRVEILTNGEPLLARVGQIERFREVVASVKEGEECAIRLTDCSIELLCELPTPFKLTGPFPEGTVSR